MAAAHGQCLCGSVTIQVKDISASLGSCHCKTCQKWAGGPFMTVDCGSDVTFEGKEHITVFNSSQWAERAFCSQCGTHLYYRLRGSNQHYVPRGLIDTEVEFHFDHQVFIDSKPPYYDFSNDTKKMTGAELFALVQESSEPA